MAIQISNPAGVPAPDGQFSQAMIVPAGMRLLFISGQVPRGPDGSTVGVNDMTTQATRVFECLAAILASHGATFSDAVKVTIFVTDMSRADEVVAVRSRFYRDAAPASTFVGVSALGDPEWLLEIELVAALEA